MDLQVQTETFNSEDRRWLGSKHAVTTAKSATLLIPTAGDNEATIYPDGLIKSGTLLAKYTSGANQGLWGVYVDDDTVAEGLGTVAGIALDGFTVRKDQDGALVSTTTIGSVLLPGSGVQVHVDLLPGLLLENGTTAFAPVAATLSGFVVVDLM